MAQPGCGPADGPAWAFTITNTAPSCALTGTPATLRINVWDSLDGAAPGTVYAIGGGGSSQGQAVYCPAGGGGPPCFTLSGTLTLDSFHSSTSASFSYELVDSSGSHYAWTHSGVDGWCPGSGLCGP